MEFNFFRCMVTINLHRISLCAYGMLNVKCNNDYSVQNDKSLRGHCTNERRVIVLYESSCGCLC